MGRIFRTLCFTYLFLTAFRLSTCPLPPPMIREYDFNSTQDEALTACRDVLISLKYEIEEFDPGDHYILTKIITRRFFLKKVDYLLFVSVEDRVRVTLYAEKREFRRFSEWGVSRDNLTELEASDRLNLSIQNRIFEELSVEFQKRGIIYRHPIHADLEDEVTIYKDIYRENNREERQWKNSQKREQIKKRELLYNYNLERDMARLKASDIAETHLSFFQNKKNVEPTNNSLISIAQCLEERDEDLRERLKLLLVDYTNYNGSLNISWVIDPDGRVMSVSVEIQSSPTAPDVDLQRVISNYWREIVFPPLTKTGFAQLHREIIFSGNRHRFSTEMKPPFLVDILSSFPEEEDEIMKNILFRKSTSLGTE